MDVLSAVHSTSQLFCRGDSLAYLAYLRKIHTKCPHIEPVQKARKALPKPAEALVHELQVHEVRLQIRHRVRQLCKLRLQPVQREGAILGAVIGIVVGVAEGGARRGAERRRGARDGGALWEAAVRV